MVSANMQTKLQRKLAQPRGMVIMKPREKFTKVGMQTLLDRVDKFGFAGCKLTLSLYLEQPHRMYRDIPGQTIRMRIFNIKSLAKLLEKIDDAAVEVEANG